MDKRQILDPSARQADFYSARTKFLMVAGLMIEITKNPKLTSDVEFIERVQEIVEDIDDFNDIADRLTQTFYQYSIDQQRKEKHYGV